MTPPAHLALFLHMHQPLYTDPASGVAALPWVRLHGARSYLDLARLLDEYGEMRLTVNFVPSLVDQLEAVVAGARDAYLDVAERDHFSPEERRFLVTRFFSINWSRAVDPRPRYRELLDKRGRDVSPAELGRRAASFTEEELRDLTVLFHLAWLGFAAREGDRELAALEEKGAGFDAGDLALVVARGRDACARVLPLYRKLAARGQVELTASPYYHPILPLLCDSDVARRALPSLALPERFAWPDDGRLQIARGKAAHARAFGAPPGGMWPPEGSISPAAIAAYREEGIGWLASDEGNLWRSLDGSHRRGELYRPYRYDGVDLVFRDREMSDRIGFSYAHGGAEEGVADLLGRARHAAALAREAGAGGPVLVPVVLDGENPWEAYPGQGEPFLRALFSALASAEDVRPTSVGGHLAAHPERSTLARLHAGSWIDSDFHIWIGDPQKNRAWDLLSRARRCYQRVLDQAAGPVAADALAPEAIRAALEHLLAAEGSDWFWWFGEPFHSAEDEIFDRLFRAHLAAAWRALGEPPPAELEEPVSGPIAGLEARPPRAFIHPRIDGRSPSYFEWHDAGCFEIPRTAGSAAMAQASVARTLYFGFDRETLFLRLDPAPGEHARLVGATVEVMLRGTRSEVTLIGRAGEAGLLLSSPHGQLGERGGATGKQARGELYELAVPFAVLGFAAGERVDLAVRLLEAGVQIGRYPIDGHLAFTVPDENFEADHWSV